MDPYVRFPTQRRYRNKKPNRQAPVWKILQHASTLTGARVIAVALLYLPAGKTEKAPIPRTYWAVVAGLTLAILAARLCSVSGMEAIWPPGCDNDFRRAHFTYHYTLANPNEKRITAAIGRQTVW